MSDLHTLPIKVDRYLAKTRHLTAAQHGAYLLLLMTAWKMEDNALPDDDEFLCRCAAMDIRTWKRNKTAVLQFWIMGPDARWRQRTLDETRKYVVDLLNKKAAAGRASALKRLNTGSTPVATPVQQNGSSQSQSQSQTIPNGIDTHMQRPNTKGKKDGNGKHELPIDFEPDAASIKFCVERNVDPIELLSEIRDWAKSKRPRYNDWQATFRNAARRSARNRPQGKSQSFNYGREPQGVVSAALRVAARYEGKN